MSKKIVVIDDLEVDDDEKEPVTVDEDEGELVFIRNENVEISNSTRPFADNKFYEGKIPNKANLPIKGKGQLNSAVIASDSRGYSIIVEVDNNNVLDDSWQSLDAVSEDIKDISAYEDKDRGDFVVVIENYRFEEWFDIKIIPEVGELQIDDFRIELYVEEFR